MRIFALKDYARVDGLTGSFVEREHASDLEFCERIVELHAGTNQYVSFQIVVETSGAPVASFALELRDLRGERGETLSAAEADAYVEWFHRTNGMLVPDMLVPLSDAFPFRIPLDERYMPDQRAGAVWIDWFVPAELPPGDYRGTFAVRANDEEREFELRLRAYAVTVPSRSRMTADLNAYADSISPEFPELRDNPLRYEDGSFFEMEAQVVRMAREHRAVYHNLGYRHSGKVTPSFAPELEGEGKRIRVKSWELFDRHFGPYLDGSAFEGSKRGAYPLEYLYLPFNLEWPARFEKWGKKGYRTETRRILAEFVRHFEEKGWTETTLEIFLNHKKQYRFYPFTIDEIWYEHDEEPMKAYYELIEGAFDSTPIPIVYRMDSSNHYGTHSRNEFAEMCKLWVVGEGMFSWFPESVPSMKAKGNTIWIYGGNVIGDLSRDLLTLFTWPMQAFMTGIHGFTVWNSFGHGGLDYLAAPNAGETILYPGARLGLRAPLPSIRLKALRNFMQLADVLMGTRGTDIEFGGPNVHDGVRRIVNRQYGYEDGFAWWRTTPDFVDTPPRIWDFSPGGAVHRACSPAFGEGRSPRTIERIGKEVLAYLEAQGWDGGER